MPTNSENRLEAIFHAAKELALPEEREVFLHDACKGDAVLLNDVNALLQASDQAEKLFRPTKANDATALAMRTPLAEQVGDRIGRYKLLQQIGEGGCGVVYMAEQFEPVKRRVALKVIKLGMDTKSVIARFEAERQALAMMDHFNIAKVLDAGATESGRPYFVMELVRGIKITDYCDQNNLSTRDRLDLFVKVCQAIQHAHQKGIIHRDIKPSNILVTLHDGVPVPKVIDFGIAKATEGRLTDQTLFTAFEQFLGTPAYMSPEQAELSGLDIDTRSDIYSLGVLLYELLTGKTPFDAKELMALGIDAMRKTIREQEPMRPSTRLSQTLVAADVSPLKSSYSKRTTEEEVRADSRRLLRIKETIALLRGDLDWIVMKALEKDRTRRYETANGFARDIGRFLSNEPVVARPPSGAYRFQKLIRRNKLAFGAAAAIALVLVLGIVVSRGQATRAIRARNEARTSELKARQAEQQATEQREVAQIEAKRAEENSILLKIQRAEDFFAADDSPTALAYLAQVLRQSPSNRVATQRLWSALSQRNFPLPMVEPLKHAGELRFADFSPDGQRIVTASADYTARVWDARTGQPVTPPLAHAAAVISARFSPDGMRVVTGSADKTARVWDARDGRALTRPLPHNYAVTTVRFSPDGRKIVTIAGYDPVCIWDVFSGALLTERLIHGNNPTSAMFSPDGQRVAVASTDHTAKIWDANTSEIITTVVHGYFVQSAQFSADGNRLVTASMDNTARVWDARTGKPLTGPLQHEAWVMDAAFSPDAQRVVTHSKDNLARTWDAQTGQPITHPFRYQAGIPSFTSSTFINKHWIQFTADGQGMLTASWDNTARLWDSLTGTPLTEPLRHDQDILSAQLNPTAPEVVTASLDQTARIWNLRAGQILAEPLEHNAEVTEATFSPDGQRVVTASEDRTAWIWDVRSGSPLVGPLQHDDFVLAVQISADGQKVATASYDHTARIWDAQTGRPLTGLLWHNDVVRSVQFSADGQRVATASDDGTARVWDGRSGKAMAGPLRHESNVVFAAFSPNGQRVITASWDKTARVWDANSGAALAKPLIHRKAVLMARFSPDGEKIITASADFTARIWNARTGESLAEIRHDGRVLAAEFSPDGKIVATASSDRTARIWDAETGQARTDSLHHREQVNSARFSPNGRLVVTASADNTARVWDAQTGQPVAEPFRHGAAVNAAQFSPDGQNIITASADHSARVWELPPDGVPVPGWLPQLAETLAGQRFGQRGVLESVPSSEFFRLKAELLATTTAEAQTTWAKWFFADRANRTISPRSHITVHEYVHRRTERPRLYSFAGTESSHVPGYVINQVRENRLNRLKEALRLEPTNHLTLARLARAVINEDENRNPRKTGEADWYSRRATEIAPDDLEARCSRAEVLAKSGRLPDALDVIERVIERQPQRPESWIAKGSILEMTNRLADAEQVFTKAIQLSTALGVPARNVQAEALLKRYYVLRKQNRPAEAAADFRTAKAELLVPVTIPPRDPKRPELIDLTPHINCLLTETWSWWPGSAKKSDFGSLPRGIQTLAGVDFDLRGDIFLRRRIPRSELFSGYSLSEQEVAGEMAEIPIAKKCKRLHFLHNETDGGTPPTGTPICQYVVHYANGQREEIPLRFARDLADWVATKPEENATYVVAWAGTNERVKQITMYRSIRLFKTTWENPDPDWEIKSLDAIATKADLHLFAITVE